MRRPIQILISLIFLAYGLIRIGVGSALLGQELRVFDFQAFRGPIHDIAGFLAKSSDKQLIHFSVAGYVSYIALMGVVLTAGAVGSLRGKLYGLQLLGASLVMYALLFVNFQTINPKAIYLVACVVLFGILFWVSRRSGSAV